MKIKSSKSKKILKAEKHFTTKNKDKDKKRPVKSKVDNSKDITALILRDHEPIKKLILILKDSEVGINKKRPAYAEFEKILSNHAKAEEESLYVHMKEEDNLRMEGLEGDIEHTLADQFMKEIAQIKNDDDSWLAKVKVLSELVDHHIKEEEKDVLAQVRKEFDVDTRIDIGREYSQLLSQFQETGSGKTKTTEHHNIRSEHV